MGWGKNPVTPPEHQAGGHSAGVPATCRGRRGNAAGNGECVVLVCSPLELEAVLHAPNQSGTATRTAWNTAAESCLRPRTPIAQALCTFRHTPGKREREVSWRLTVDGIPLLGNSHVGGVRPASFGYGAHLAGQPGQPDCIILGLARELKRWPISCQSRSPGLLRAEVWLAQSPEGVEQCVWDVVVLAAITAMEQGRRFMAATLAGDPQETPGPSLLERAMTRVVVEFRGRLRVLRPSVFRGRVGPRHSLLRGVAGELHCARPEQLEMGD
jgi:hypothetical protein